jgi:hypothetical protein
MGGGVGLTEGDWVCGGAQKVQVSVVVLVVGVEVSEGVHAGVVREQDDGVIVIVSVPLVVVDERLELGVLMQELG